MSLSVIPFFIIWLINGTSFGAFDDAIISVRAVFLQYWHLSSRRHSCCVEARTEISFMLYLLSQCGQVLFFLTCLIMSSSSKKFMWCSFV